MTTQPGPISRDPLHFVPTAAALGVPQHIGHAASMAVANLIPSDTATQTAASIISRSGLQAVGR